MTWKIHLNLPKTNSPKVVERTTQSWSWNIVLSLMSYGTTKRKKRRCYLKWLSMSTFIWLLSLVFNLFRQLAPLSGQTFDIGKELAISAICGSNSNWSPCFKIISLCIHHSVDDWCLCLTSGFFLACSFCCWIPEVAVVPSVLIVHELSSSWSWVPLGLSSSSLQDHIWIFSTCLSTG